MSPPHLVVFSLSLRSPLFACLTLLSLSLSFAGRPSSLSFSASGPDGARRKKEREERREKEDPLNVLSLALLFIHPEWLFSSLPIKE